MNLVEVDVLRSLTVYYRALHLLHLTHESILDAHPPQIRTKTNRAAGACRKQDERTLDFDVD